MKRYLKAIKNLLKKPLGAKDNKNLPSGEKVNSVSVVPEKKNFCMSDYPITEPTKDEFKRWPFAQKIAQTISSSFDSNSIVVGIYGKWGEGKTTVLKFIETEIKKDSRIICIWFNPWLFRDEDRLLLHFFGVLSEALKKSLSSSKEIVGQLLKYGSNVIPSIPIFMQDGTKMEVDAGKSLEKLGESLSSVDVNDLKLRLEKILKSEKKRIVILMDDIDRLDKAEIQNIFKLVKLTADFPYTSYVLTFDQEMVSAAIGEKYGGGSQEGSNFLEKIIQIPLDLPALNKTSLRNYCFNIVDGALKASEVELNEGQTRKFVRCFVDLLEIRLKTPRMAKRYGNILTFALPIIGKEVNLVDLMLIEGARVFYPELYILIKTKPDIFLGAWLDSGRNEQKVKEKILKYINESMENLDEDEKDSAKELIIFLFPRLSGIFGRGNYGAEWEEKWAQDKRIASKAYFNRFFSYSIAEDDISDSEIEEFLEKTKIANIEDISSEIKKLVGERKAEIFISKLRKHEKRLPEDVSRNLALSISKIGHIFPNPDVLFSFTGAFSQAGIFISWLVKNVENKDKRFELAKLIVQSGEPVSFASECFLWMQASKEEQNEDRLFAKEEEGELGIILASRIKELSKKETIFLSSSRVAPRLFAIWSDWGEKEEIGKYLTEEINKRPRNVIALIKCYLPQAYGMESGLPVQTDFERREYDVIKKLIDPEILYNALVKEFGNLEAKEYQRHSDVDNDNYDEILARQFAYIHHKVMLENKK